MESKNVPTEDVLTKGCQIMCLHYLVLLGERKLKWFMLHFSMSSLFKLCSAEHLCSAGDF